jgi:hypothetical protein
VQHVVTFLRNEEGRRPGPPIKDVSIIVKYVEAPPEAYTRQELEDSFRVSDEDEKFLWRFFLGTGNKWLGHADLETTLRYLAVGEDTSDDVRKSTVMSAGELALPDSLPFHSGSGTKGSATQH